MTIPDASIGLANLTARARNRLREEMRAEVEAEFRQIYDGFLASVRGRLAEADRIIANHKFRFSKAEFMMIVASLHPDHNSYHRGREAFELFRALEGVFVRPEPKFAPGHVPLPTMAEMLATRAAREQERRERRANRGSPVVMRRGN